MGGALRRAAQNWNLEHRAQKQIYKDLQNARAAPPIERMKEIMEEAKIEVKTNKDKTLDDNLVNRISNMTIESKPDDGATVGSIVKDTSRPKPQNRSSIEDFKYGHPIPKLIPDGKITLEQALALLAKYKNENTDLDILAKEYKIDQIALADIVEHFCLFDLKTPEELKKQMIDYRTIKDGYITASEKDDRAITDK